MSKIMCLINQECLKLFALELKKKSYISLCLYSSIYKYQPISMKLGKKKIYDHRILDEFDSGSN